MLSQNSAPSFAIEKSPSNPTFPAMIGGWSGFGNFGFWSP